MNKNTILEEIEYLSDSKNYEGNWTFSIFVCESPKRIEEKINKIKDYINNDLLKIIEKEFIKFKRKFHYESIEDFLMRYERFDIFEEKRYNNLLEELKLCTSSEEYEESIIIFSNAIKKIKLKKW